MFQKILFSCLMCFMCFSSNAQNWERFESAHGRFVVYTQGMFQEKIDTQTTALGNTTLFHFIYQPDDIKTADNLIYMITYYEFPEGGMHSDSLELIREFYDETIEAAALSVEGEVIYESPVQSKGYKGRQWRINYLDGQATIRTKAFIVKNRFYSIQTVTLTEKRMNKSTERFFNSFKILY